MREKNVGFSSFLLSCVTNLKHELQASWKIKQDFCV